jgi:hypothetical protein
LRSVELKGQQLVVPSSWTDATWLQCVSRDCRDESVTLTWDGSDARSRLQLGEERYGLPAFAVSLQRARGTSAMPSQDGDRVVLIKDLSLPESLSVIEPAR